MRFMPLCKYHEGHTQHYYVNTIMSRCSCYNNKKCCDLILRPWGHYDNHYIWRLLWLHQPSSRNWLTEKVYIGYAKGVGWGVWTKSGICSSKWRKILWAHSVRFIQCCNMWLGHEGSDITGTSWNSNIGNEVETGMEIHWMLMPTIKPRILQVSLTRVISTNVLDEGLRIEEIGRRMNSKVKLVKQGGYRK
jgi:hypothetical protein